MASRRTASSLTITSLATLACLCLSTTASADESAKTAPTTAPRVSATTDIEAGRYIVQVSGCNDCHTANWMETGGQIADTDWLTGSPIGWQGPWGTTYASNLRAVVQDLDEDAWVKVLQTRTDRPPMPWMNVNQISDADARATYRFVRSLGMRGERMPAAVAPGVEPATPYFVLEPQHLERMPPAKMSAAAPPQPGSN